MDIIDYTNDIKPGEINPPKEIMGAIEFSCYEVYAPQLDDIVILEGKPLLVINSLPLPKGQVKIKCRKS